MRDVARAFSTLTAEIFDGSFEYRFAYKLRNYAQHFGMPIGHMRNVGTLQPGPPETKLYDTSICFDVADLLSRRKRPLGTTRTRAPRGSSIAGR